MLLVKNCFQQVSAVGYMEGAKMLQRINKYLSAEKAKGAQQLQREGKNTELVNSHDHKKTKIYSNTFLSLKILNLKLKWAILIQNCSKKFDFCV